MSVALAFLGGAFFGFILFAMLMAGRGNDDDQSK